jgi:hypothetical protein
VNEIPFKICIKLYFCLHKSRVKMYKMSVMFVCHYVCMHKYCSAGGESLVGSQQSPLPARNSRCFVWSKLSLLMFTRAWHWTLSWYRPLHFTPSYSSSWRYTLILSSHLCQDIPHGLFSLRFYDQCSICISHFTITCRKIANVKNILLIYFKDSIGVSTDT